MIGWILIPVVIVGGRKVIKRGPSCSGCLTLIGLIYAMILIIVLISNDYTAAQLPEVAVHTAWAIIYNSFGAIQTIFQGGGTYTIH